MGELSEQTRMLIDEYLSDPNMLLMKDPFVRGVTLEKTYNNGIVECNTKQKVMLPNLAFNEIDQSEYLRELDPMSHKVLYDSNVPSITAKTDTGSYIEIEFKKLAVSFQRNIKDKQTLHLSRNPMDFTLMETNPTDKQMNDFVTFKQYWNLRNQDGMKTKMVDTQKSVGDAGLLYYFDHRGRIKSRILSYPKYVLCPQNDQNGDRIIESVYYKNALGEHIDAYDDVYHYHFIKNKDPKIEKEWILDKQEEHGFSEIPLITKRGKVAWDNVQSLIEVYEILYNIFIVIQKRHGWGILYIKGAFTEQVKKLAGAVIIQDTSLEGKGSAEYKTPPNPEGTLETLQLLYDTIQIGSGTTSILPKDIKISGNISGIAIQLTQSMDIETALQGVIDWQNVADKMARLFKEGLAKELVNEGVQPTAITDFENLNINAKFTVWKPQSETELTQQLVMLKMNGILSKESAIEQSIFSRTDEKQRVAKEEEAARLLGEQDSKQAMNEHNEKMKQESELNKLTNT